VDKDPHQNDIESNNQEDSDDDVESDASDDVLMRALLEDTDEEDEQEGGVTGEGIRNAPSADLIGESSTFLNCDGSNIWAVFISKAEMEDSGEFIVRHFFLSQFVFSNYISVPYSRKTHHNNIPNSYHLIIAVF
jgi:hypothetical protein